MSKYSHDRKSEEYRLLKHRYRKLLKSGNSIGCESYFYDRILMHHVTENGLLERILDIDEELKKAYRLKEEYLAFDQCSEEYCMTHDKEKELTSLIRKMELSGIQEFKEVAATLKNWKKEILYSFTWINGHRINNGPIEGKNNFVKKILSNANGMMNFERARNRIMYSQNPDQTYTSAEPGDSIERPGTVRGKYKKRQK